MSDASPSTGQRRPAASMQADTPSPPRHRWLLPACAATLFLLHAVNYLYFFVDDEGIPFVYARNLLRGRGLIYSATEGRVEGYSDFLAVIIDALLLGITGAFHAHPAAVFALGKAVSLAAGTGLVLVLTRYCERQYGRAPAVAGAAVLVLAGPLAAWSCSSLEVAGVALLTALLAIGVWERWWQAAAVAGTLLVLLRIDGPVYAGAVLCGALIAMPRGERRSIATRVIAPIVLVTFAYHAWRVWYFEALLPAPLQSKVLFKLDPRSPVLTRLPGEPYLMRVLDLYGLWLCTLVVAASAFIRNWRGTAALIASALLCAYVAIVGDWMFGFRFFVQMLPMIALLCAAAIDGLAARSAALARAATAALAVWLCVVAAAFARSFEASEHKPLFLAAPSRSPQRFFGSYWSLYEGLKGLVPPGTSIAYNQAGFVPFMLDADNIDNLGICSRFYADLPTRDVYFTEVGRYAPLTNKDVRTAGLSYLLNREPRVIVEREELVRGGNDGAVPSALLGGAYARAGEQPSARDVVYLRTQEPTADYHRDSTRYLENVAHVANVAQATENGTVLTAAALRRRSFLREGQSKVSAGPVYSLEIAFSAGDVPVYELHVERLVADGPADATLALLDALGHRLHEERLALAPNRPGALHVRLPGPVRARRAMLLLRATATSTARVLVGDLRVQGQTPALAAYIRAHVPFR